jgi:hypothetical protein
VNFQRIFEIQVAQTPGEIRRGTTLCIGERVSASSKTNVTELFIGEQRPEHSPEAHLNRDVDTGIPRARRVSIFPASTVREVEQIVDGVPSKSSAERRMEGDLLLLLRRQIPVAARSRQKIG